MGKISKIIKSGFYTKIQNIIKTANRQIQFQGYWSTLKLKKANLKVKIICLERTLFLKILKKSKKFSAKFLPKNL